MRTDYRGGLAEEELAADWPTQFGRWLDEAVAAGLVEPNAMVLATADPTGAPTARAVLLKGYDSEGFRFFTNFGSTKGRQLAANPAASLVFPWWGLHRQVIVVGSVRQVGRASTERYFAMRPRGAQLAAWASPQSRVLVDRAELDHAWERAADRFGRDAPVPAPPFWGGYQVIPSSVEFWQGRPSRLHDRLRFRWVGDRAEWVVERLAP